MAGREEDAAGLGMVANFNKYRFVLERVSIFPHPSHLLFTHQSIAYLSPAQCTLNTTRVSHCGRDVVVCVTVQCMRVFCCCCSPCLKQTL